MKKAHNLYPFHLNISVILFGILLGAVVTCTFAEYSDHSSNEIQLVDFEEDGDTEELEDKDLNQIVDQEENNTCANNVSSIIQHNLSTEVRYCKIPTPPPEY
jgi:hypothetical protein